MVLAGLVLAIVLAARDGGGLPGRGRVAILEIDGIIEDDERLLEQVRRIRDDGSVKAVVVSINSPGGSVGPSQSIYREFKRLKEEDDLPVIASIGTVGASGGYYVALAADSIFVLPGSMTGSIGVILQLPDVRGLMNKIGVGVNVVMSDENKDLGSPFREMTPQDSALLAMMVEDVYNQFFDAVVSERKLDAQQVRPIADGRVLTGAQAERAGLVDRIGNLHDAIATAGRLADLGSDPELYYPRKERPTLFDLFFGPDAAVAKAGVQSVLGGGRSSPRLQYLIPF